MSDGRDEPLTLLTIGHGLRSEAEFFLTLRHHAINAIVDVRSEPTSARAPHFNSVVLRQALRRQKIEYVPMGSEFGGRPWEPELYDEQGYVLYGLLAKTPRFEYGIRRLEAGLRKFNLAVLCSEVEPTRCHRNLLVGRIMRLRGHNVAHIMADGSIQRFDDRLIETVGLPGFEEEEWKSLVQVRPDLPRKNSFGG